MPLIAAGAGTALVAGMTGSLHCGLMCGPLACAGLPPTARAGAVASWHLGRVAAYTAVGALLGALGTAVSLSLTFSVQPYLPYVMAAGLLATALDLGRHVRPLPVLGRIARGLAGWSRGLSPVGRSLALGAATPFLPCGLLYGIFLAALATNSVPGAAAVMFSFSLGAVPVLLAAQLGARHLERWPTAALVLRRALPIAAAVVLVARALMAQDARPDCH